MKNLLITGGAGFIGLNTIEYFLQKREYKISVLDNLTVGKRDNLNKMVGNLGFSVESRLTESKKTVFFLKGDIRDKSDIEKIMPNQDYVIHLAGKAGVLPSVENPDEDAEANIFGTLNLLQSSVKHGIKKFIFASSGAVLGEHLPPLDENGIARPMSPYGASKLACEGYCSAFYHSFNLPVVVLRFSSVYGKYSCHKESLIAKFIKNIITGKKLIVNGDGNQTRDFLYAGDIPKLIYPLIEKKFDNFELFQLGTGEERSVNDIVDILKKISGKNFEVKYTEKSPGEIRKNFTSINKYISYFHIKPKTDLSLGCKETFEWFKEHLN